MNSFKDKVILITGGNSGIGYATAKEFASAGAKVLITGRRKEAVERAAKELGATAFVSDQAKLPDTDALYREILKQYGKIDVLFINAGITGFGGLIEQADETNFDSVMNTNFKGAYFMLSKFIPLLNEGAAVVILSSIVASTYQANSSIYQASKAALNSIAKTAAAELADRKIRVNIVSPGPTRTSVLTKAGMDDAASEQLFDQLALNIPLKRTGTPDDIAKMVTFLASDATSFVTGAEFVIDGGMTI
ncbi:short-chain dehydrogenase [Chitinophaga caeni]|uniref:Short-chain dehydrogenase n=1 Tax=Chitinophaga caeni TaxID=2029983 RepID=A0A291QY82_9BACT|nr:glucose 1-dehydrogenase [Chitinophaga caeni]ATL48900.1 short-chain dehydrogenase [Chitinophaga caeni]